MRAGSPTAKLIYRNRRRLGLFCALLICIFGAFLIKITRWLSYGFWVEDIVILYVLGVFAAILTVLFMVPAVLIVRFAPNWRRMIEFLCWGTPVGYMMLKSLDGLAPNSVAAQYPLITSYLAFHILTNVLTRFPLLQRFRLQTRGRFSSQISAADLWESHFPAPTPAHRKHSPLTSAITVDPDNPTTLHVTYDLGTHTSAYRHELTACDKPTLFSYITYEAETGKEVGTYTTKIQDQGTYRCVDLAFTFTNLGPLNWLHVWCDDLMGQEADHFTARETGAEDLSLIKLQHDVAIQAKAAKDKTLQKAAA